MNTMSIPLNYEQALRAALPYCLTETNFAFGKKYRGKVRDTYDLGDRLLLVTTDRQSAFDRYIAAIPCKGQVLNLTSLWWFEQTEHIQANHLLAVPDPNVMIAKKCRVFPIEFVVRAYISGSTGTALWTQYQKGLRAYCGHRLPEGLKKNQALPEVILTPTTKEAEHDRPISAEEIIAEGWMSQADWEEASAAALKLFHYGSEIARQQGLILVDTKYEFGRDANGQLTLVDELHTPDSSRYWLAESYEARIAAGLEPDNIDKEFLRLWYVDHCNPYEDEVLPEAPEELVLTLAGRYVQLYEKITGHAFNFAHSRAQAQPRIVKNVAGYLG